MDDTAKADRVCEAPCARQQFVWLRTGDLGSLVVRRRTIG
jgi:hypothetical protein